MSALALKSFRSGRPSQPADAIPQLVRSPDTIYDRLTKWTSVNLLERLTSFYLISWDVTFQLVAYDSIWESITSQLVSGKTTHIIDNENTTHTSRFGESIPRFLGWGPKPRDHATGESVKDKS